MRTTSAAAAVLAFVVLLSGVGPVVTAAVPDARLTVSDLSVAPDAPVTGEPVTVTATVRNSGGSPEPVEVDRVLLRDAGADETLVRVEEPGALSQGDTLTVDLTRTFAAAGRVDLEVVVVGTDADGDETRAIRPLTLVVEESPPQLDAELTEPVADVENRVEVTVTNPTTTDRRNLELGLSGAEAVDGRAVLPALAAGESETVNLSVRPPAGESTLTVTLAYTTSTGERDETSLELPVVAEPLREDVGVAVRPAPPPEAQTQPGGQLGALLGAAGAGAGAAGSAGGGTLQSSDEGAEGTESVVVEVTNFGNTDVREVVVEPRAGDRTLPRRAVGPLAPGESGTVTVDLTDVPGSTLTAVATYRVGDTGRTGSATGQFEYDPPAGEVRLTDVDLEFREDGTLLVTGNAGNVGDGEVTGVVVAVGESEHVAPAYPQRDYFVGTVEGSEFAPFELTADVDARNASAIPVEVRYRVGGEDRTENVSLPYDRSLAPEERRSGGFVSRLPFSPGTTGALAGVGLALVLLVPAVYLVRRR